MHLSESDLENYLDGIAKNKKKIEDHLEKCQECRERLKFLEKTDQVMQFMVQASEEIKASRESLSSQISKEELERAQSRMLSRLKERWASQGIITESKPAEKDFSRKQKIFNLAKKFVSRFYPQELEFFEDLWKFLEGRSLPEIAGYDYQRVPSSIGTFGSGEGEEKIGENAVISLASIASVFEQEQVDDVDEISADRLKTLLKQKAKSKGASPKLAKKLSDYLS